mmetsp:Transcript_47914/g.158787  ORF Transcript_47914/g.158787 Transcript_47914/m.158787 type:complete len:277 (+) Transcript_47914:588-1418(+)
MSSVSCKLMSAERQNVFRNQFRSHRSASEPRAESPSGAHACCHSSRVLLRCSSASSAPSDPQCSRSMSKSCRGRRQACATCRERMTSGTDISCAQWYIALAASRSTRLLAAAGSGPSTVCPVSMLLLPTVTRPASSRAPPRWMIRAVLSRKSCGCRSAKPATPVQAAAIMRVTPMGGASRYNAVRCSSRGAMPSSSPRCGSPPSPSFVIARATRNGTWPSPVLRSVVRTSSTYRVQASCSPPRPRSTGRLGWPAASRARARRSRHRSSVREQRRGW